MELRKVNEMDSQNKICTLESRIMSKTAFLENTQQSERLITITETCEACDGQGGYWEEE